jgi:hypothetical protein
MCALEALKILNTSFIKNGFGVPSFTVPPNIHMHLTLRICRLSRHKFDLVFNHVFKEATREFDRFETENWLILALPPYEIRLFAVHFSPITNSEMRRRSARSHTPGVPSLKVPKFSEQSVADIV